MKEVKRVPRLRFSEFNEELMNVGFTELGKILIGLTHKPEYLDNGIPFLSSKNISNGYIDFEDIHYISSKKFESMSKSSKPKKGDILFTRVGSNLGNPIVFEEDLEFAIFVSLGIFRTNNKASNFFIKHWMDSNYFWRQVEQKVAGGAKNNLNTGWLKEFKLNIPQLPEQQKIASFLSSVDKKIDQLQQKQHLLEQYKKGVMQQVFSQQLRFKDENGNDYPDWEEKKLGGITNYYDGTHQTPKYVKEGVPFYSVEHVTANQFESTKFISEEVFEKENKRVKLEKGDILMTRIGSIGKAKYIDWDVRASFYVSLALIKNNPSFSGKYLSQYINATPFQRELWKRIIHVAFPQKINLGELGKCIVKLPVIEEQTKIANFLSAIDKKIELVSTQIENTQQFKKGLLQQMFV